MSPAKISTSHQLAQLRRKHSDSLSHHEQASTFHTTRDHLTSSLYQKSFRSLYAFFFLEMSLLILWVAYRAFAHFPVWFDEGVAKAIVFGVPVFWFTLRSRFISNEIGLDPEKLIPGLYLGLAIGGLYGFIGILSEVSGGRHVVVGNLFASSQFWWLGFLALLTAWWESLFFFGLPIQYIRSVASWLSDWMVGGFVVALFLLFHAPLRLLTAGPSLQFALQMGVLSLFVVGQYILYTRTKNMYSLVLSHALWGLVIQVYAR